MALSFPACDRNHSRSCSRGASHERRSEVFDLLEETVEASEEHVAIFVVGVSFGLCPGGTGGVGRGFTQLRGSGGRKDQGISFGSNAGGSHTKPGACSYVSEFVALQGVRVDPLSSGTPPSTLSPNLHPFWRYPSALPFFVVKCWGENFWGQVGQNDSLVRGDDASDMGDSLPYVPLGDFEASLVASGSEFSCALAVDGDVKCWGRNSAGQLGLGDNETRGGEDDVFEMGDDLPVLDLGTGVAVESIALAGSHACAVLAGGNLKCWGENEGGQLGLGDTLTRGNATGQMGDDLPFVDLGDGVLASSVALGARHSCAVVWDGDVKCWGEIVTSSACSSEQGRWNRTIVYFRAAVALVCDPGGNISIGVNVSSRWYDSTQAHWLVCSCPHPRSALSW